MEETDLDSMEVATMKEVVYGGASLRSRIKKRVGQELKMDPGLKVLKLMKASNGAKVLDQGLMKRLKEYALKEVKEEVKQVLLERLVKRAMGS